MYEMASIKITFFRKTRPHRSFTLQKRLEHRPIPWKIEMMVW